MNIVWFLLLILSFSKSEAFNMSVRLAEWDGEYRHGDPVKKMLKLYSRGRNITRAEEDSLQFDKREVKLDRSDTRRGKLIARRSLIFLPCTSANCMPNN